MERMSYRRNNKESTEVNISVMNGTKLGLIRISQNATIFGKWEYTLASTLCKSRSKFVAMARRSSFR